MPKISVIIPVYKVEKYIEKCARSLFEQSLEDMEFIFVDDCTPDNSITIVKSVVEDYPNRKKQIKYLSHEKNQGLTSTRNLGLSVALGDYIAYCDSDDWVDIYMYEKLYNHAIVENADVCFCNFQFAFKDKLDYYECTSVYADKTKTINSYISTLWTVIWNMIVKREILVDYELKSPENISYCEDFYLSVRLFYYANKIIKLDEALYFYNQMNVNSIMHGINLRAESDERWAYLDTIQFFKEKGVYNEYKKTMCWRVLKSTQDAAVYIDRYRDFLTLYPESHKYIWNCPFINNWKSRVIMLFLAFYPSRFVGIFIIWLRNLIQR